jgi:outer membrane protein OmpA-like peptidoglycan-associated protein
MLRALALLLACTRLQAAPFDKGGLLGVGASEAGQAGAVVARIDDGDSLWWNPAGLDRRRDFDLGLSYGQVLGDAAFDTAFDHRGWIAPLALGYGVGYRHVGFNAGADEQEYALGVAFPFTDDERLLVGLDLRALQSDSGVAGVEGHGYGVDVGLDYHPPLAHDALTLGLALRDVQAGLDWSSGILANPVQLFQAGAAWAFDPDTSAEFDAELASDPSTGGPSGEGFKLGAERWWNLPRYGYKHLVALRLGYLQSSALAPTALGGQFSVGLGLALKDASLDYAVTQEVSALGPTQRLSGSYRFGSSRGAAAKPKAAPTPGPSPVAAQSWSLTLTASTAIFNPLNHGSQLAFNAAAAGPLSEAAQCVLEILPSLGPPVFDFVKRGLVADWSWDGRQASGAWAAPGGYQAQLSVLDAQGLTLSSAGTHFQLDLGGGTLRMLAQDDVFAPIPQSARPNAVLVLGYQGADAKRWTLNIVREGAGRPVRVLSGRKLPARLLWDGHDRHNRKVPDGTYRLSLNLQTASGATLTAQARVDVDTRRPTVALDAQPRVFVPKGDVGSVSFSVALGGEAGIPARWALNIETLQGKKLKTFAGKGSPPQQVVWNGVDEAGQGVPGGALYYADFVVEMESGAQARQPRVALASKLEEPKQPFKLTLQSVRFEEGDEVIALEDYQSLKETAAAVKKYSSDYVLLITGSAAPGEAGKAGLGELELSFLRAKAVRDYLVESEGIPADKVKASGHGAEDQAAGGLPGPAARAKARRVDITIYTQ